MEFELHDQEYIELIKLLKLISLVQSGGEAKLVVEQGKVKVNKVVELQKRKKLRKGDLVSFDGKNIEII